ncbi:MAG: SurA N-terminal domain-containing protein [Syntrophobacteraceae bacterium]|nr:SurA N-terminal domain-containing protein [Syntrophobacteraceae bacterium]
MLDFVRQHSRSWGIKVLLIALIIVFIGWGGYLYQTRHSNDLALVGDHYISQEEYSTQYENMVESIRKQFGGAVPQKLMAALDIKNQALDTLVRHYLVVRGARELGLEATPEEVRAAIAKIPGFQSDGKFDLQRYKALLWQHKMTPEDFEQQMADDITASNAQVFITGQAVVTNSEIKSYYDFDNDQIQLAYTLFDPASFQKQVKVDDAALKAFYKQNQSKYMEPEKRQIAYVELNVDALENDIKPTAAQIKQYYDDNGAEFTHGEQVRARRILLRIKPGASGAELKTANARAAKILDEAGKGADFSTLAKKYSQDKATAKNGGELGFFSYQGMSTEFSKAAFALKPGQMSGVVRTPSGLDIIKVEEVQKAGILPLAGVQDKIIKELKSLGARDLAYKQAQELRDLAYARQDIAKAALELKMKASAPVWITLSENQAQAGSLTRSIREKLFQLGQSDVSDMLDIRGGYLVAQVKSIKKPEPAPLEKEKDKVTSDFRMAEANKLALKQASATLESARAQKSLAAAAKASNISITRSGYFSRQAPDKALKLLQGANLDSVFSLGASNLFPARPLQLGTSYMVCQFVGQKPAGAPSKQQIAEISHIILQQKRAVIWKTWLGEIAKTTKIEYLRKL